jgi:hypothetical protein
MVARRVSSSTSAKIFLNHIRFYQRLKDGSWTSIEIRQIIKNAIKDYFSGKVDEEFVVYIGSAIHHNVFHDDEALTSVTCMIDDIAFDQSQKQGTNIDQTFKKALRLMEK